MINVPRHFILHENLLFFSHLPIQQADRPSACTDVELGSSSEGNIIHVSRKIKFYQYHSQVVKLVFSFLSVSLKVNLRVLKELVAAGGHLGPRAVGCHGGMMKAQKQKFVVCF